ncbi:MAG: DUF6624 domain-containing protein [Planctomycetota bacterium]
MFPTPLLAAGSPVALFCLVSFQAIAHPQLAQELAEMVRQDQAAIQKFIQSTDPQQRKAATAAKEDLIERNTKRVQAIFDEHGFQGKAEVGDEGAGDFWLLVQHADHVPEFQRAVLKRMKLAVEQQNADPQHYAYLWDRVCKNAGKPQRFGTQVGYTSQGQAVPLQLESPQQVNARRSAIGLEPIEDYLNDMTAGHFEMNRALLEAQGVEGPAVYPLGYSQRDAFAAPAH